MATHRFTCKDCNYEIFTEDTKTPHICPTCGNRMDWDLGGCNIRGDGTYSKKVISEALAINANQGEEHRRLFPNVELTPMDGSLCPTFSDFKTHDAYLEATGFVKHPQRLHNTRKTYT